VGGDGEGVVRALAVSLSVSLSLSLALALALALSLSLSLSPSAPHTPPPRPSATPPRGLARGGMGREPRPRAAQPHPTQAPPHLGADARVGTGRGSPAPSLSRCLAVSLSRSLALSLSLSRSLSLPPSHRPAQAPPHLGARREGGNGEGPRGSGPPQGRTIPPNPSATPQVHNHTPAPSNLQVYGHTPTAEKHGRPPQTAHAETLHAKSLPSNSHPAAPQATSGPPATGHVAAETHASSFPDRRTRSPRGSTPNRPDVWSTARQGPRHRPQRHQRPTDEHARCNRRHHPQPAASEVALHFFQCLLLDRRGTPEMRQC
jgi:hypothetical protein